MFKYIKMLLSGKFLEKNLSKKSICLIVYVILLTIAYMSINFLIDGTLIESRKNQLEIKNLKSDYTSKAAKLQYLSKRGEIELQLVEKGSKLSKPTTPAKVMILTE